MGSRLPWDSANAAGNAPTSKVHWFTVEDVSVPMLAAAAPRSAKSTATMNSGDSETSGASHCTSRNSSMWNVRPTASRLSANGSAAV